MYVKHLMGGNQNINVLFVDKSFRFDTLVILFVQNEQGLDRSYALVNDVIYKVFTSTVINAVAHNESTPGYIVEDAQHLPDLLPNFRLEYLVLCESNTLGMLSVEGITVNYTEMVELEISDDQPLQKILEYNQKWILAMSTTRVYLYKSGEANIEKIIYTCVDDEVIHDITLTQESRVVITGLNLVMVQAF